MGQRGPALAVVGLRWLSWAYGGGFVVVVAHGVVVTCASWGDVASSSAGISVSSL